MTSVAVSDVICRVSSEQHGLCSRRQLVEAGLSRAAVSSRVESGWLVVVYPGVYSVGRPVDTQRGRWMAAVLDCGPGAVLCRASAATLLGFGSENPRTAVLRSFNRSRRTRARDFGRYPDLRFAIHRTRYLPPHEVTAIDGIPTTSVARTLLDLASVLSRGQLERYFDSAGRMGLLDWQALASMMNRGPGWRGLGNLKMLITSSDPELERSRSWLELEFLNLCRRAGISEPLMNSRAGRFEVDFLWKEEKVVVELDGFEFHGARDSFESDRVRDADLHLAGYAVIRFTYRKVTGDPEFVVSRVRGALARA
ncbi:MAG TPA: DUF559 domain-containing protein [Solirubrobacterales bacterium]|nr:DUF559 domain-containing protein [Solirubrobacterales bacterium]